ncbi:hypothetical protein P7K49_017508 [Saguinus oedipus]|uniref:Secreted protein n=1 Tax=Saguinus oedipus TaxID=9490 RepID=A0ABQ9V2P8_SAGOE|nr:hypothetical protein P7K49_017508 [Saguinus oedipus]
MARFVVVPLLVLVSLFGLEAIQRKSLLRSGAGPSPPAPTLCSPLCAFSFRYLPPSFPSWPPGGLIQGSVCGEAVGWPASRGGGRGRCAPGTRASCSFRRRAGETFACGVRRAGTKFRALIGVRAPRWGESFSSALSSRATREQLEWERVPKDAELRAVNARRGAWVWGRRRPGQPVRCGSAFLGPESCGRLLGAR